MIVRWIYWALVVAEVLVMLALLVLVPVLALCKAAKRGDEMSGR